MKVESRRLAIALLGLTVLASGCTQTTNNGSSVSTTPNTAVSIQSFSTFPQEVPPDSNVQVEMELQNTGGQTINDLEVELFNIPFQGSGDTVWSGENTRNITNLRAPDTEAGVPSSPRTITFDLTSPNLQQDVRIPYDIFAELSFDYSTVGTTQIQLMSQERYRQSGATRSQPSVDNTAGPVKLSVRTRTPIVYYGDNNQQETEPRFCVVARNVGSGTPSLPGDNSDDAQDKLELSVSSAGQVGISPQNDNRVELIGNRGVNCYDVTGLSGINFNNQLTLPVTVTANYDYTKETSTTVTVNGRR